MSKQVEFVRATITIAVDANYLVDHPEAAKHAAFYKRSLQDAIDLAADKIRDRLRPEFFTVTTEY